MGLLWHVREGAGTHGQVDDVCEGWGYLLSSKFDCSGINKVNTSCRGVLKVLDNFEDIFFIDPFKIVTATSVGHGFLHLT